MVDGGIGDDLIDGIDEELVPAPQAPAPAPVAPVTPVLPVVPQPPVAPVTPDPPVGDGELPAPCSPNYRPCVIDDGDDRNCGDFDFRVEVVTIGVDPFGLDQDSDGFGCEGSPPSESGELDEALRRAEADG